VSRGLHALYRSARPGVADVRVEVAEWAREGDTRSYVGSCTPPARTGRSRSAASTGTRARAARGREQNSCSTRAVRSARRNPGALAQLTELARRRSVTPPRGRPLLGKREDDRGEDTYTT